MQEIKIKDEKGQNFIINFDGKNYNIKKEDGTNPTKEEMEFILVELAKIKKNNLNMPKSYDDYLATLRELLRSGQIKSTIELENFINSLSLSPEEKEKLLREGISGLNISDIIFLRNRIIETLRTNKTDDLSAIIDFNVKDNSVGAKYCEIKMGFQDEIGYVEHINETLNYDENLKTELIEPVLLEVTLQSEVASKEVVPTPDTINNRGNFNLQTKNKIKFNLRNAEFDYADNLDKRSEAIKNEKSITDAEKRDEESNELQSEEYGIPNADDLVTDEYGNMYDLDGNYIGRINEYGEIIRDKEPTLTEEKGMSRVRRPLSDIKRKESGFTIVYIVFAVTSFITSLLVILQIFFLK